MAMTATYTTFAGMVVHQRKNGVDTELISDPLGSVVKTKDAAGNETSRTEYWPYGEVQSATGSNPTPFGFIGTLGYYTDLATRLYVRARYLRPDQGRWQTVDPLWPEESAYGYVNGQPSGYTDRSGLVPEGCESYRRSASAYCDACRKNGFGRKCMRRCNEMVQFWKDHCLIGYPVPRPKPIDVPPTGGNPCKRMAAGWSHRFGKNGVLEDWWKSDCVGCCAFLWQEPWFVDQCPESGEVLESCMNDCFDGKFGIGGLNIQNVVGAVRDFYASEE